MTTLYLCEKPSQARDIARVLGANQRSDGYLEGSNICITWCFGHLLEMASPEDYDPELKHWCMASLPIIPDQWQWKVRKEAKKQYAIITQLFKRADEIVIATDADREGEAIAREVMQQVRWQGKVSRLWLSALDDASIKKGLANLLPGKQTEPLFQAAVARSKADWLVGMTLSRAYTLSAHASGMDGVMPVGRVQTPTLNLVVTRDRLIENFKPVPYFEVLADFEKDDAKLTAHWQVPDTLADEDRRCLSQSSAKTVAARCLNQTGSVTKAETQRIKEAPPLPYSLSSLQQEASKRFGFGAQQVLDIAQALYETHKATTYPRTDCSYLPETQQGDATAIIQELQQLDDYQAIAKLADASLKSRAFNDKKITAHHAIIPVAVAVDISRMKADEKKLYDLICRRYLAQFYPDYEYDQTAIEITVGQDVFTVKGRVTSLAGWKSVLMEFPVETGQKQLPPFSMKDRVKVTDTRIEDKQTQAPPQFTEGTLILAMKSVGKTVAEPSLKKMLKETSGIGTEATRASIIETLLKGRFLAHQGKHLISTASARTLMDALPDAVKDPATTAVWEQALDDIAQGKRSAEQFVQDQIKTVRTLTEQVKQTLPQAFTTSDQKAPVFDCPACKQPLRRRKCKTGFFWGCSAYPECTMTLPDDHNKPGQSRQTPKKTGQLCPECETGDMLQRKVKKGKHRGKTFLGCSNFPTCTHSEWG